MSVTLDADAQAVLDRGKALNLPPFEAITPDEARERVRKMREALKQKVPEVPEVTSLTARGRHGDIPLRLYRSKALGLGETQPALIYFHGGGWLFGDLDSHDILCRHLAIAADCTVIAVDYRLAPEHKFPAAFEDSYDAAMWIASFARDLHIDRKRLAVGGDSAGGNLATTVAIMARQEGFEPPFTGQILVYPSVDLGFVHESHQRVGEGFMLTAASMRWFRDHYLRGAEDVKDWRASPLRHQDHSKLPPAFIITAAGDPLHDEGEAYGRALKAAGVRVTHRHFAGQMHAFIGMSGYIKAADEAVADIARELRRDWGSA